MGTLLPILVLIGTLVALVTAILALQAWIRLRRTRAALRSHLSSEVAWLARRTTELEENFAILNTRSQALPVRITELQHNLATLRVLTNALGTSLQQAQRLLSSTSLSSSLIHPFAEAFRSGSNEGSVNSGEGEASRT